MAVVQRERLQKRLDAINAIGAQPDGGVTRLAFTEEEEQALALCERWMREAGLHVRRDAFGNVIARYGDPRAAVPVVMTGSHLDTVPNGGRFDGVVGVVSALEAVSLLAESRAETVNPVEVVIFRGEESSRFGVATLGSRAFTGQLSRAELDQLRDRDGITLAQAMRAAGLEPDRVAEARYPAPVAAFLEVHVEQGRVLDEGACPLGIVTAIAAPTRLRVSVSGQAAHSGATPMDRRRDALAGAAEVVLAVEEAARSEAGRGTVGTVGVLKVFPGAMNVVPGEVELGIDIRSIDGDSKRRTVQQVRQALTDICTRRGLEHEVIVLADEEPVTLSPRLQEVLATAADALGYRYRRLFSPAGHDAMNLARVGEAGMIFVPSREGISHNPREHTDMEHIAAGAEVLFIALCRLSGVREEAVQAFLGRRTG